MKDKIEMTNDAVNKYIHVEIMGKCWHEFSDKWPADAERYSKDGEKCKHCDKGHRALSANPNYCSDNSPRSLLNEVVVKVLASDRGIYYLSYALDVVGHEGITDDAVLDMLTATAEQTARACVEAHKAK